MVLVVIMEKSLKLLCGAQAFGFGPISKLSTIVKHLQRDNINIDFYGEGAALQFAQKNIKIDTFIHSLEHCKPLDYMGVLTVMNPELAAWGYYYNIPIIAVDSLYWFWQWTEKEKKIIRESLQDKKQTGSCQQFIEYIRSLPDHMQQYALHLMADKSFVQKYPGGKRKQEEPEINTISVGPIVDLTYLENVKRDTITISFSGMFNPLVNKNQLVIYLKLCAMILKEALMKLAMKFKIVITVNLAVYNEAKSIFSEEVVCYSHKEFLQQLNKSVVMIAPAGITTIYECIVYKTPILFLPEQHDGHFKNYLHFSQSMNNIELFRNIFPESLLNFRFGLPDHENPLLYTKALFSVYERMLQGEFHSVLLAMKENINNSLLSIDRSDAQSICCQQEIMSNFFSDTHSLFESLNLNSFNE